MQSLWDLDAYSYAALEGLDDPREQLYAIGTAYITFAVEHPAEFRLMFRPEMGTPLTMDDPTAAPVYRILLQVVQRLRAAGLGSGPVDIAAITAWSLVHGLAALLIDGPLAPLCADPARIHALIHEVTHKLTIV